MLNTFKLLLPALIPGWNFFDVISASPRIQFTLLQTENEKPQKWIDFRPHSERISLLKMLGRLFFNAKWNESLFITSCAERLLSNPTTHSEIEIFQRIVNDLNRYSNSDYSVSKTLLQFRILIIKRENTQLQQEIAYCSPIMTLPLLDNR